MKRLRLATGVEDEIRAAARWYEEQRAGIGKQFLDDVDEVLQRLPEAPAAHSLTGGSFGGQPFRHAFLLRFPYRVVFLEREDELFVLACAHTSRRPGYWRARLTDR